MIEKIEQELRDTLADAETPRGFSWENRYHNNPAISSCDRLFVARCSPENIRALLAELDRRAERIVELEKAGYGKPVIRRVERAPLVFDNARDDERCRWPDCTCYGPQAHNHCKRQTHRTLSDRTQEERDG